MKLTAILAVVAAATVVSASTNAERFARGLPPNSPMKRGTPVELGARHAKPSGNPAKCNKGSLYCCKNVGKAGKDAAIDKLLGLLGLTAHPNTMVGTDCSPITVIGLGSSGAKCTEQTVCCKDVHSNGLVNLDCTPININ